MRFTVGLVVVVGLLIPSAARAQDAPVASDPPPATDTPASCSACSSCRAGSCSRTSCSCRDTHPKIRLSVTGVRASDTRIATPYGQSDSLGLAFAGGVDSYALDGSTHGSLNWVLGGGEAGFEGMLAGTIDVGYRLDVTERQGPFGRAGFDGRMQGNDKLYFSTLELPRLTLGWQYLDGRTVIEVGARGGPILAGRYNPGDEGHRRLSGAFEYGGFASAQIDFLRVDAAVMRIAAKNTGNGRPVDVARGSLCAIAGKVGVCADVMAFRGDADMGPSAGGMQRTNSMVAGLSVGVASW
jgi:hypothetical protein